MSKHSIELIEEELGAFYPEDFKQFILAIQAKGKIQLKIIGEDFKLMEHLVGFGTIAEDMDDVLYVAHSINKDFKEEDPGYIKLPFAKSLDEYGFDYLYFLAKPGLTASPEVYYRDADWREHKRIQVASNFTQLTDSYSNLLNFIANSRTWPVTIITSNPAISNFLPPVPLPEIITLDSKDGLQIVSRSYPVLNSKNEWKLEFNLELCRVKVKEMVYYSIVHMNSMICINGLCLNSDIHFWIEGKLLQPALEIDSFAVIYYYRMAMILNAVDKILSDLPEGWTKEQVLQVMDQQSLDDICRTPTTQIDYSYYDS
ncbi:SMI1/KNR4 family protein [Cytophagaceae bacterium YF14B1]|uniref:SMI1/KNR4 family protein n=1 Tax=Xanthocytophaga flava TaxID=3048013 RepID=A0AAE3QSJ9_9BACT|nr:SMI1/KNR4 family protein [Xanthocytophaga flavus]MDJ1482456.1 SMI1/KNR4 family protein [Xanthocytophaga flavus]